jgi:hypothetical protein
MPGRWPCAAGASGRRECSRRLLCRQVARLPPIEDRLGDIRREIAEPDEPSEIGPADPFPAARVRQSGCLRPGRGAALKRHALMSSLINRASAFDAANGSVPSITILISRPARRSRTGTDRISVSSSFTLCDVAAASRSGAPVAEPAAPPLRWRQSARGNWWTRDDARGGLHLVLYETRRGWAGRASTPSGQGC